MTAGFRPEVILAALNRHGVDFVVIGGIALAAHGIRRPTLDLDIVPARQPANSERLAAALAELGAGTGVDSQFRDLDPTDPFDVARAESLPVETSAGPLDLVNVPKGLDSYDELARAAIDVVVLGERARVVDRDRLIAMKRASGRPRDLQDVADLTAGEVDP